MPNPLAGLAVVGLGASLAAMDLAVNVAFPSITRAFALDVGEIRWLVVCYVLTYASLMLAFGRLGDRIGHRRVFRAGLVLGIAAYALCALAPSYGLLLVARVLQGVSTALVLSCAPALATFLFEESKRTRALGAFSSFTAIAGIVAPILGGASIAVLGWAGVFWFRVPVALAAMLLMPLIPEEPETAASRSAYQPLLDGSLLFAAGLALLLLAFTLALSPGPRWWTALAALCGIAVTALFVVRQRRDPQPLLPRAAVKDPSFVLPNVGSVLLHFVVFAVPLLVPYYLERIAGHAPWTSGAALACSPLGILIGSMLAAAIVRRFGARSAALAGGALVVAGQLAVGMWTETSAAAFVLLTLLVHGSGMGVFHVAYTDLVVAALPRSDRGVAGSLTSLTRTIGVITAAAGLTALLSAIESQAIGAGQLPAAAFVDGFRRVFMLSALALAVLLPLCLVRLRAVPGRN